MKKIFESVKLENFFSITILAVYLLSITVGPALNVNNVDRPFVIAEVTGSMLTANDYQIHKADRALFGLNYCRSEKEFLIFSILKSEAINSNIVVDEADIAEYVASSGNRLLQVILSSDSVEYKTNKTKAKKVVRDILLVEKVKKSMGFPELPSAPEKTYTVALSSTSLDLDLYDNYADDAGLYDRVAKVEYVDVELQSDLDKGDLSFQAKEIYDRLYSQNSFQTSEIRSANIYVVPEDLQKQFEEDVRAFKDLFKYDPYINSTFYNESYQPGYVSDIVFSLAGVGSYDKRRNKEGKRFYIVLLDLVKPQKISFSLVKDSIIKSLLEEDILYKEKRTLNDCNSLFNKRKDIKVAYINENDVQVRYSSMHRSIFTDSNYAGAMRLLPQEDVSKYDLTQTIRIYRVKKISKVRVLPGSDQFKKIAKKKMIDEFVQSANIDDAPLFDLSAGSFIYGFPYKITQAVLNPSRKVGRKYYYYEEGADKLYIFEIKQIYSEDESTFIENLKLYNKEKNAILKSLWKSRRVRSSKFTVNNI